MNQKQPVPMSLFVIGLILAFGVSSCASFKLVSQRPVAGHSVDAVAAATSGEDTSTPASDQPAPAKAAPATSADASE
jgi:hypothetical protein